MSEQPMGRRLVGPPHAHRDGPCTDACYAPNEQAAAPRIWRLDIPPEPLDVDEVTLHCAGMAVRRFRRDNSLGGNPRIWNECVGGMGLIGAAWHDLLARGEVREVIDHG